MRDVITLCLLATILGLHGCSSAQSILPSSTNAVRSTWCPWSRPTGKQPDVELGFYMGSCGAPQQCKPGHYIKSFRLGIVGKPSDACGGPVSSVQSCLEKNKRARLGFFQGVCSDGTKLAAFKADGGHKTATIKSKNDRGFASVKAASNSAACCSVASFMHIGVTHLKSTKYKCPQGTKIVGYVVGIQEFSGKAMDLTYIGLKCA